MNARPRLALGRREDAERLTVALAAELALPGALQAGRDTHGRPTLCVGDRPVAISRSHAGDSCAVAMSLQGRVGVDLVSPEGWLPLRLEAHFHPSERRWLAGLSGLARDQASLQCWAAKEAVLKALGLGLAFGLDGVELEPEGAGDLRVVRIFGQDAEGWQLEFSRHQGLLVALAWIS